MTLENLKKESVRANNVIVVYPQLQQEKVLDCTWAEEYNGCFAVNNGTVAFAIEGNLYVTPYTKAVLRTLQAADFRWEQFYVPFSNWDYPYSKKEEWLRLRRKAARN